MIICGMIQSPNENDSRLIIHQIDGKPLCNHSIIDAQIRLTTSGTCITKKGFKYWRRRWQWKNPREVYIQAITNNVDDLGRKIALGIYVRKEGNERPNREITTKSIINLLDKFSLDMDEALIVNIASCINDDFLTRKKSSLLLYLVCSVFLLTVILFFLFSKYWR